VLASIKKPCCPQNFFPNLIHSPSFAQMASTPNAQSPMFFISINFTPIYAPLNFLQCILKMRKFVGINSLLMQNCHSSLRSKRLAQRLSLNIWPEGGRWVSSLGEAFAKGRLSQRQNYLQFRRQATALAK
jgi:hypothetical protein